MLPYYQPKIIFLVYQVHLCPSIYDLGVKASPLGLANADVSKRGEGRSMLTVADGGVKSKNLLA